MTPDERAYGTLLRAARAILLQAQELSEHSESIQAGYDLREALYHVDQEASSV